LAYKPLLNPSLEIFLCFMRERERKKKSIIKKGGYKMERYLFFIF
jgi:hypothetical protein